MSLYIKLAWDKAKEILPDYMLREVIRQSRAKAGGHTKAMRRKVAQGIELDEPGASDVHVATTDWSKGRTPEVFRRTSHFVHKNRDQQIVYGIVLEPDVPDGQGDIIMAKDIEEACHYFMENSQQVGHQHMDKADAKVVESYIAPMDFRLGGQLIRKGTWVMATKVYNPQLWQQIRNGELTGYSIGGFGVRGEVNE